MAEHVCGTTRDKEPSNEKYLLTNGQLLIEDVHISSPVGSSLRDTDMSGVKPITLKSSAKKRETGHSTKSPKRRVGKIQPFTDKFH